MTIRQQNTFTDFNGLVPSRQGISYLVIRFGFIATILGCSSQQASSTNLNCLEVGSEVHVTDLDSCVSVLKVQTYVTLSNSIQRQHQSQKWQRRI